MDQPGLNRLRVQDRNELSTLLSVLHGAMNALHRDECGDWTIAGSRGHIRACSASAGAIPRPAQLGRRRIVAKRIGG